MRKYGVKEPYEQLKQATRGRKLDAELFKVILDELELPAADTTNFSANALLAHMAEKLVVSRWQRDLSDSTVLRNIGSAIGHCSIAYQATMRGLSRLSVNRACRNTLVTPSS